MLKSKRKLSPGRATGFDMIRHILVENFRCYRRLEISKTARLNVIVGENGSGKTALLEAIFLALGRSPELGVRFRQHRGLEGSFAGQIRHIEEALWRTLFYEGNWEKPLRVELVGDGAESRTVRVFRGKQQLSITLANSNAGEEQHAAPISFVWKNHLGREYFLTPQVRRDKIEFEGTEEDHADFFLFPSNQLISSSETASRFSQLSRKGGAPKFITMFAKEYPFINDISIEVEAGQPLLFAGINGQKEKFPLAYVSGGINRIFSALVALAVSENSVVLIDEVENGIYYKHMPAVCRMLYEVALSNGTQLIVTTHSEEWLSALADSVPSNELALWRTLRTQRGHEVEEFTGDTLKAGIEYGQEIRGG